MPGSVDALEVGRDWLGWSKRRSCTSQQLRSVSRQIHRNQDLRGVLGPFADT